MSNIEQERFYYVDSGIGEKTPGCPYTHYQDGRDIKSFIVPPRGYELTGFKLEPYPETDAFYDGKIVAQYKKIPFAASFKKNPWKYILTIFSFLSVFAVLAFFFTNRRPKHSTQHFNPYTEIVSRPVDSTNYEQDTAASTMIIAEASGSEEPIAETTVVEEVAKEEKLIEDTPPTENVVEHNVKESETSQAPVEEAKPEQEAQTTTALTQDQFHKELWDLIHNKERHMRTYHDLYKKYKGLHLKTKEYYYLYLTILENTTAFEEWKAKLVRIPDNELQSINTINALKQRIETYE